MNKNLKSLDFWFNNQMGRVTQIIDGVIYTTGLETVGFGELVDIVVVSNQEIIPAIVFNIEHNRVGLNAFVSETNVVPGDYVFRTGNLMRVPQGDNLLGRIVNPLGLPIDGGDNIISKDFSLVEAPAPSIISRAPVKQSLVTGIKVVDCLVPIGHGQRELIIGDSKTGKTTVAVDSILSQKGTDTISVYVAIGQKRSSVARIAKLLKERDCLKNTIIVAATASDTAAFQFVAPYAGTAIGEYFMHKGLPVLVIYDDLSKHAVSYRQLSLLLRRPPGREGFPGDIFYAHSRLLERSANLSKGGSLTALPIVETIQDDVSAYIPTNVISITDGQIYLNKGLFSRGIRPAISPGLSVSRVGSAAQKKSLKNLAGDLKLELAQYYEVEDFANLGFTLDDATQQLINRGERLTQILVQPRNKPISVSNQILFLYSALQGYIDWLPKNLVHLYESSFYSFLNKSVYNLPFQVGLGDNLNKKIVSFFVWSFTAYFIEHVVYISKE